MKVLFLILCLVTSFPAQTFPIENGWQGIIVLQTSRVEVEKLFGKPIEKRVYERYETEDAFIDVAYSFAPCSDDNRGEFNLPKDTVLNYTVVIRKEIKLSDFKWKKDLYERYEDTHAWGLTHYYNKKDGIRFHTNNVNDGIEKVSIIYFERTKELSTKYACKKK